MGICVCVCHLVTSKIFLVMMAVFLLRKVFRASEGVSGDSRSTALTPRS